jgi:hypothetical protein
VTKVAAALAGMKRDDEMSPPRTEKRALETAIKTAELQTAHHVLSLLQTAFGFVWYIDKARLQDRNANKRDDNR